MREFIKTVYNILETKLFSMGQTNITPVAIIELILIIIVFLVVSKFVRKLFQRRVLPRFKLADGVQFVILKLIHYTLIIIGMLIALNLVGIQLTSLAVVFGLMGVGIAFGLQNITSNFISGIILLFERPVSVGDYVEVGGAIGRVESINIRSTTVVTPDNVALIVPNSQFIESTVTNWSVGDSKIRIDIPVGIAYGSDTELVNRLLLKAAEDHPQVLSDPKSDVLFQEFGDSSLNFALRVWIPDPTGRPKITSDLNYAIDAAFRENNISIPFPQQDVHFFSET